MIDWGGVLTLHGSETSRLTSRGHTRWSCWSTGIRFGWHRGVISLMKWVRGSFRKELCSFCSRYSQVTYRMDLCHSGLHVTYQQYPFIHPQAVSRAVSSSPRWPLLVSNQCFCVKNKIVWWYWARLQASLSIHNTRQEASHKVRKQLGRNLSGLLQPPLFVWKWMAVPAWTCWAAARSTEGRSEVNMEVHFISSRT